eukprot:6994896-Prymnesium_polylepis.1
MVPSLWVACPARRARYFTSYKLLQVAKHPARRPTRRPLDRVPEPRLGEKRTQATPRSRSGLLGPKDRV